MKVSELIEKLAKMPPDSEVWILEGATPEKPGKGIFYPVEVELSPKKTTVWLKVE